MATLVITPEIEAGAQRLAERAGTTPTEALATVIREKLAVDLPAAEPRKVTFEEFSELVRQLQALPFDRMLTEDEILGYDEDGIPEQPYLGR